jgi:ABC-type transport system involved in multi-copper enzyme maturation permease subunit
VKDAIAAEWLKVRSIRSSYCILAVIAAIAVAGEAVTLYAVHVWDHLTAARRAGFMVTPPDQLTGDFAQLLLGVLGVLAITAEYATGMIRTSLVAVPRRRTLLAAKAAILGLIALATAAVITTASFLLSRMIVGRRPMRFFTEPMTHEIPVLLALTATAAVAALLGLGLGTVLRSSAGAITALAGLWYVLPIFTHLLPDPWSNWLDSVLLVNLPQELSGTQQLSPGGPRTLLSPPGAALALAAYAAAALAAAAAAISRRDA